MGKVSSAYDSVIGGVSEQEAHLRRSGQHAEQINLISDPVHGLIRRRGSVWLAETSHAGSLASLSADGNAMREYTFIVNGVEYSIIYRKNASTAGKTSFLYCYRKDTKQFVPVVYENSTFIDNLVQGGVSALVGAGRYLYLAGNSTDVSYTQVDNWSPVANSRYSAVWIRAGTYLRKYTVTCTKADGTEVVGEYTTPSSAYSGVLDTSDIPIYKDDGTTVDPAYQKNINDRVNAYNNAVAQWILTAAQAIVPEKIAEMLAADLQSKGIACAASDAHVEIDDVSVVEVSATDGGDNTNVRWAGQQLTDATLVTLYHHIGKIVRIRPLGSTDKESYYLQATAKEAGATGWGQVIWREAPGVVTTPTHMLAIATVQAGTLYMAQDGPGLETISGLTGVPSFKPSTVGDGVSSPTPNFFDQPITMLAMFQDRLVVGSGGTVNCSVTGDYLNFFRQTVLQIIATDPVEMYAFGSEGDTMRYPAMYDKSLIIFGDKKQYAIDGRTVLSPQNPLIVISSAHENAAFTAPVASGNFVFYSKYAKGRTSMHQLQYGQLLTSPVSYEVSQQLDTYISGSPCQLTATTAPNMVLFRTETQASKFFVYQYLDDSGGGQRLFDSWSSWQFANNVGTVIGTSSYLGEVLIFTMRDGGPAGVYIVADSINLSNESSDLPYFDSAKPYSALGTGWHAYAAAAMQTAVDSGSSYYLMGVNYPDTATLIDQLGADITPHLYVGSYCDAYVEPTNPFVRDQKGNAILNGRLTLSQVTPTVRNTGSLIGNVWTTNGTDRNLQFEGRILGRNTNIIAQQPRITGTLPPMAVGREVRECAYSFTSETWLPMCITSLDWTGQFFSRVRRV